MSKLAPQEDAPAAVQAVLTIVAASDAGSRRYKKRLRVKRTTKAVRKPTAHLRFDSWTIKLYGLDGTFFITPCKGDYAYVVARRDEYLKTGRYEKSWIQTNV